MRLIVLGAGAGGGSPQWNCACPVCRRVRAGDPAAPPRTQSSIAVSADGDRWLIVNASPDITAQIARTPALHPRRPGRDSPIAGVVLTNADVDHVAGLLSLRESQAFPVYATERVHAVLDANRIFDVLNRDLVPRRILPPDDPMRLADPEGAPLGLTVELVAVPGKVALWLEDPDKPDFGSVAGDTAGLRITDDDGGEAWYVPGCAAMPETLARRLAGAPLVLFDGTTFTDAEMAETGVGHKTAGRMGHMPMAGPHGSLAAFAELDVRRRVYVHINNTNPVLCADTPERRTVEDAGWQVAFDGMEITV